MSETGPPEERPRLKITLLDRAKEANIYDFVLASGRVFPKYDLEPLPTFDTTKCPHCGDILSVIDSRPRDSFGPSLVFRRRRCENCYKTISTVEIPVMAMLELMGASKFHEGQRVADALRRLADELSPPKKEK